MKRPSHQLFTQVSSINPLASKCEFHGRKPNPESGRALPTVLLRTVLCVMIGLVGCGCEGYYGNKPGMKQLTADGTARTDPVVLAAGDLVKVSFPGAPEYSGTQKITADGNISLPFIGEVHAAGKQTGQLQAELSGKFESQLQNSDVVVTLESTGSSVVISGGVRTPGKLALDRPMTLLEVIFQAGGFNEFADRKKVRLIRVSGGEYLTQTYDLAGAMNGKAASLIYVKSGDLIDVEERTW